VVRAAQRDCAAGSPSCLLFNPATAPYVDVYLNPFKAAAASLGLEGFPVPVREESEFETIFAAQARTPNNGLVLIPDGFLNVLV
jgi:putative ABC transport system substrate-binding protein